MLRRQALGALTNQTNQIHQNKQHQTTKQVINHREITISTFESNINENEIKITNNNDNNNKILNINESKPSMNFDFEIFQDIDINKENHQYIDKNLNTKNLNKRPLQVLNIKNDNKQEVKIDSPMILDVSLDSIKFQTKSDIDVDDTTIDDDNEDDYEDIDDYNKILITERENALYDCNEYSNEIFQYLKNIEIKTRAKPNYLKQQQDITGSMRSVLVDWLVEVCEEYKLHTETLYLAVNYTDRFLSKMSVLRGKLQLLGTAAIYIASKYEEIFPPDINEFVYITDDTYTKQQVLRMEHLILKTLDFRMSTATSSWFLLYYLKQINENKKIEYLSRYLTELTLIDAEPYLNYLPSQIASSALYLSMYTFGKLWKKEFFNIIGYQLNDLRSCIHDLHKTMSNAPAHAQQAIQDKYKQERFGCVSLIQAPKYLNI